MGNLEGRIALVTGSSRGIGEYMAKYLSQAGAKVAIAARTTEVTDKRLPGSIYSVAHEIREEGGVATSIKMNMRDPISISDGISQTVEELGGLDIVVNNAGISPHDNIENLDMDNWNTIRGVVLDGVMLGCKHTLPLLKKSTCGAIVNVSSVAGMVGSSEYTSYGAAKAGVRNVTKSIALHCARKRYSVRCNSVHPGSIDTPILDADKVKYGEEKTIQVRTKAIPMGRLGLAREVANAILFLASDDASFITGAELVIDGGFTAR